MELKGREGICTSEHRNEMPKQGPFKWTILWEMYVVIRIEKGQGRQEDKTVKDGLIPYLVHGESFGLCLIVKKSKKTSQRPSKRATPLLSLLYFFFQLTHSVGTAAPAENPLVTMPGITFPNLLTERTDELCLFSPLKFTAFVNSFWSYSSTSPSPSYSLGRQSIVQRVQLFSMCKRKGLQ